MGNLHFMRRHIVITLERRQLKNVAGCRAQLNEILTDRLHKRHGDLPLPAAIHRDNDMADLMGERVDDDLGDFPDFTVRRADF